jgi:hypothetical protein
VALACHRRSRPLCAGLAVLWSSLEPANDRDWQTDPAVLAHATIDGEKVTVHNIRNFGYRSETDYPPEDVYVYRTRGSIEAEQRLFLEYMRRINALQTQPEF